MIFPLLHQQFFKKKVSSNFTLQKRCVILLKLIQNQEQNI